MKKVHLILMSLIVFALTSFNQVTAQTSIEPLGNGTSEDPYIIESLNNLYWITQNTASWEKNFIQTANIDATSTSTWDSGSGFSPIGNSSDSFKGTYIGQGYSIDNLYINRISDYQAFIGKTENATLSGIVLNNVNITGDNYAGGICSYFVLGSMSYCQASGSVTADRAGGLIGGATGIASGTTISVYNCSSSCNVTGQSKGGGLFGSLYNAVVNECFSTGSVLLNGIASNTYAGGWAGSISGDNTVIEDCYTTSNINNSATGGSAYAGGFSGFIGESADSYNCYASGSVNATNTKRGFIARVLSSPTVNNSFFDTETTGQSISGISGATGHTTILMTTTSTFTNAGWDFESIWDRTNEVNNGYPTLKFLMPDPPSTIYWNGSENNEWSNGNNWSEGSVPTSSDNIIIQTSINNPILSGSAICRNIEMQTGVNFIISSENSNLTINENLTNDGTITIKSSASGEGSLLVNGDLSGSGTYNVERYLSSGQWHLVSSPITNGLSGVFNDIWLRPYDESTNDFGEYITPTTTPMPSGEGFSVWAENAETRTFSGIINNGSIGPLSAQLTNEGWNLMGNPYPSAIDWDAASGWTKTNLNDAVYIWDGTQYTTYADGIGNYGGSRYIAPGQGFFVQANSSGASLSMDNDVRVHNTVSFMKSTNSDPENIIRIKVSGNGYSDEAVIAIRESDSFAFDQMKDAHKLTGSSNAPQMHIQKDDMSKLSIASFSNIEDIENKAIYINYAQEGEHIISWTNTISENVIPNLIDQITGQAIPAGTNYSFTASNSDMPNRFIFSTDPLNIKENIKDMAVWEYDNILYVNNFDNRINEVSIFNIQGIKVLESTGTRFDLNSLTPAMYIVKVQSGNKTKIEKIIVK